MQMKFETCSDECHHCGVENCPEEYCPPRPLLIPPDYAKSLFRRWKMEKRVLPPVLKMILKTR